MSDTRGLLHVPGINKKKITNWEFVGCLKFVSLVLKFVGILLWVWVRIYYYMVSGEEPICSHV